MDPSEVAGDFGNHSLYKNLGYFSLIGLLRLHTQLGDYYNALDSVKNVTISKKVRSAPVLCVFVIDWLLSLNSKYSAIGHSSVSECTYNTTTQKTLQH